MLPSLSLLCCANQSESNLAWQAPFIISTKTESDSQRSPAASALVSRCTGFSARLKMHTHSLGPQHVSGSRGRPQENILHEERHAMRRRGRVASESTRPEPLRMHVRGKHLAESFAGLPQRALPTNRQSHSLLHSLRPARVFMGQQLVIIAESWVLSEVD